MMQPRQLTLPILLLLSPCGLAVESGDAGDFDQFLKPLFAESCTKCHGEKKTKGKVNLLEITTEAQFLGKPQLIEDLIGAIDAHDMPPEDEPDLTDSDRARLLATLKGMLLEATADSVTEHVQIRRLNRFQYNNAVKDIFQLNRNVFRLPEKLMTRHTDYLNAGQDRLPDQVRVSCRSLDSGGGLNDVNAFPKDLRAAHGFDNQANQLSLSPLLFDTFLKLSMSILESPDFSEATVGIWKDFFLAPGAGVDVEAEVRRRLEPFLMQAFRRSVDEETLNRYTAYTLSKIRQELSFTDSMKKVASAVLSSPLFLYRYGTVDDKEDLFGVASNLSFFLWGSGPSPELLELAASGELAKSDVFASTVEEMLNDPRIERFLDTFPAQWMQLENTLAATPDPGIARIFSLDKSNPASTQMVLEPLLLFDAIFIEDRPIIELIAPSFSYQSEFLKAWYTSDLKAPKGDANQLAENNRAKDAQRRSLAATIKATRAALQALDKLVNARILAARKKNPRKPVDLKPVAAWEFNGDLRDSIGSLDLQAHGNVRFDRGMAVLDKAYLQSGKLSTDLKAKTLEVWCKVHNVDQSGGGVMGIQGPGDFFDAIVLGEITARHWISGSNGHSRTKAFPNSVPEDNADQPLHLTMVYQEDGTTTLYRNGAPYGKPYRKGAATFPKAKSSVFFGLRHLPPANGKYLGVSLGRARLYDRALTAAEVAASNDIDNDYVTSEELMAALTPDQKTRRDALRKTLAQTEAALKAVPPNQDPKKAQEAANRKFDDEMRRKVRSESFERVTTSDPRYGGVITNAAMLSMTSGPKRTHPIARGAWVIEVIFNDPPPPPPNNVPPLSEDEDEKNLTIRERFAQHRENPDCAGCHVRLDPLGFALENFDITGRWRDHYSNGRKVDASGTLMKKHEFDGIVRFKESLVSEQKRFAKAFTEHLLRFALARELGPADAVTVGEIVDRTEKDDFRMKSLIHAVIRSARFLQSN